MNDRLPNRSPRAAAGSAHRVALPMRGAADYCATVLIWGTALAVTAVCLWLVGDIFRHGIGQISWEFLTTEPQNAGRAGGIGTILVSTLWILAVCLAVSLPIGVGTAAFLAEFAPREQHFGRLVRRSLDVLAAVPSIVFGLFGNVVFCIYLRMGFSIASGGLTLAAMVLPILIRSTEEGFRAVPRDYRLAAAALGMSRTTTLARILLPAALPGLAAGLVLGIGRALAETAALLFTAGYVVRMPASMWDSGRALSVHIYDLSNIAGGDRRAYASALVLIALLLAINAAAGWIAERWLHRRLILR